MLFKNTQCLFSGILPFVFITMICSGYAYWVNAQRADSDPQKRDFHPLAIFLAPVTLPFFLITLLLVFLLRAVLFGAILILFVFLLVFAHEPVILKWLLKKALAFGNKLLEVNTALLEFWHIRKAGPRAHDSPYNWDSSARRFI